MLRQDLAGEKEAVSRYKERIRAALEVGEYGLARVLQDIIVMEGEHVKDLEMALGVDHATSAVCEICAAAIHEKPQG